MRLIGAIIAVTALTPFSTSLALPMPWPTDAAAGESDRLRDAGADRLPNVRDRAPGLDSDLVTVSSAAKQPLLEHRLFPQKVATRWDPPLSLPEAPEGPAVQLAPQRNNASGKWLIAIPLAFLAIILCLVARKLFIRVGVKVAEQRNYIESPSSSPAGPPGGGCRPVASVVPVTPFCHWCGRPLVRAEVGAQEILAIWNRSDQGRLNPDLLVLVKSLSSVQKRLIAHQAISGRAIHLRVCLKCGPTVME
jgi:hypothetical protein